MKAGNTACAAQTSRGRHVRLACYGALSLSLTLVAYYYLGFDRQRALAYAVVSFISLLLLNFRCVLGSIEPSALRHKD